MPARLGLMFRLHGCGPSAAVRVVFFLCFYVLCFFLMTLVFFIVALSRTNSAVEIEMTTWFSLSPFQVFISH